MKLAVVIVGINQWEQFTRKLIAEIQSSEPTVKIYCVDAGSKEPYPKVEGVKMYHQKTKSYAEAINIAANAAFKAGADWVLSMNNDVTCLGKFAHILEGLRDDAIHARQIITENNFTWFGNWIVLLSKRVWKTVGEFDPDYLICGFEDADYSARAKAVNIPTVPIDLPFFHHWGTTRWGVPNYPQIREANIWRFTDKFGWTPGADMKGTHD